MLKIAIIGSGGFLGSALVDYFSSKAQLILYKKSEINYIVKENNVTEIGTLENSFIDVSHIQGCDYVLYLIGGDFKRGLSFDDQIKFNSPLFQNFLNDLKGFGVNIPKVVFFSSAGTIYGSSLDVVNEKSITNPYGSYGQIKLHLENILIEYSNKFNIPYLILRISNPFGIGQSYIKTNGLIVNIINNLHKNCQISVPRDLEVYRDYIYIDDLLYIIYKLLNKRSSGIFNLCSGTSFSIKEILNIIDEIGLPLKLINNDFNNPGVKYNFISNQKLIDEIGIIDFVTVEKGIKLINNIIKLSK